MEGKDIQTPHNIMPHQVFVYHAVYIRDVKPLVLKAELNQDQYEDDEIIFSRPQ